ncbi:MAG: undecaprenyl-diphosphatase UppP [Omnitrophica WOR_2 bacterium GWA2_47_8]|nr:MAG: undecaprenyl-diphosphatase UppP [Omnitrophica WOR_2 bacterium GWA2_47_8]
MDIVQAFILGIVEGITEFLPISSTGHLILATRLLGIPQSEFTKSFEIIIQLGAILAVVVLYWKSLLLDHEVLKRVIGAFIPTAVLGLLFYKTIKKFILANHDVVLWSLFLGGIVLIVFEIFYKENKKPLQEIRELSYKDAFFIGLFQSLALVPGVSRAGATIIGGLLLGLQRRMIVEFSFLLAVPTMLAATGMELVKNIHAFSADQMAALAIGFIVSFFTAILSIRFLLSFIKKNNFISFGVYRIIIVLLFWGGMK